MTWFPDMGHKSMVAVGDHIRAVGWLHPDHPFPQGQVSAEFIARLRKFVQSGCRCADELYWGVFMGFHTCEFCQKARGLRNLGVPAGQVLFVAPEMVVHYVEQHRYAPPAEFVSAVLVSPLPGTPEYRVAVEPFRQIHMRQLKESQGGA
jgi:hypothetical protein